MNLVLPAILIGMGSWGIASAVKSVRRWQTPTTTSLSPELDVDAVKNETCDNLVTAVFDTTSTPIDVVLHGDSLTSGGETAHAIGHAIESAAHALHL